MSKKIDWNVLQEGHGARPLPGAAQRGPKYRSGREYLQKGLEMEAQQKAMQEHMAQAQPAMEALLKCRMEDSTPITVVRPFDYVASELVHNRNQTWSDEAGGWVEGEVLDSSFQDVRKSIPVGTQLVLKSLDPNLQEFIFDDQNGNELVIPYGAKQGLLMQTNIYEDVLNFINNRGD